MSLRVNNISLSLDEDRNLLNKKVAKKLGIKENDIKSINIIKESLDARKKNQIKFTYALDVEVQDEPKVIKRIKDNDIKVNKIEEALEFIYGEKALNTRPIVVGLGPAGLFAALTLAEHGYNPIVIERGEDVDSRSKTVDEFWKSGVLNENSNVQFGEGGAGAFSDGKLTTRIKDKRCDYVLRELVEGGAPEEIKYIAKPHIGTDLLKDVVKNIREKIKSLGGEVRFNSKLEHINISENKVKSIVVNGEEIPCEVLILALGHSARDTYEMLHEIGLNMEPKAFAIGVRIEHPQEIINTSQYGESAGHPKLKAAEYRLAHTDKNTGRSIYSFCMCPGGVVVAASSEKNRLVSNGMSYHARDKENANSAVVVTVGPEDFEGDSPLRGMEFQRHYEELAFNLGGGDYKAPIQLLGDFMNDRVSTEFKTVTPSFTRGHNFKDLRECLPSYVVDALKEGITAFDKKIKGYGHPDTILTGIETRTSAPVRLNRNESLESVNLSGLFPAGEGAGFAGGIVSAAVDGIKVAESLMNNYAKK